MTGTARYRVSDRDLGVRTFATRDTEGFLEGIEHGVRRFVPRGGVLEIIGIDASTVRGALVWVLHRNERLQVWMSDVAYYQYPSVLSV